MQMHFSDREYPSELARLVLAHLESGPQHAVAMIAAMEQFRGINIEPGTLYRLLAHLEQKGWVEPRGTDDQLRSYSLTDAGASILSQQRPTLHKPHTRKDVPNWMGVNVMSITWILRLYPRAWRERYEAEVRALLEQHTNTPLTIVDMLLAALDAHFDPHFKTQRGPISTQRLSLAAIAFICVFPVFLLAQFFWSTQVSDPSGTLYDAFKIEMNINSVAITSGTITNGSIILIWLAVLVGGQLIAATTIHYALSTRRIRLLLVASLLGLLTLLSPLLLALWFTINASNPGSFFFISIVIVILGPLTSLLLTVIALAQRNMGRRIVRLLLVPATLATFAMTAILFANIVWAVSLWTDIFQSQSFTIPSSTFEQWLTGWVINFLLMALPTLIALVFLIRGILALTTSHKPFSPLRPAPFQEQL